MARMTNIDPEVMAEEAKALAKRFESVRNRAQVAREHGLNPTMIMQNIKGDRPISLEYASAYCKIFNVDMSEISKRFIDAYEKAKPFIKNDADLGSEKKTIPVIDAKLSAGHGELIYSTDEKTELTFRSDYLYKKGGKNGKYAIFKVKGDSMVDAHIPDESHVLLLLNYKAVKPGKIYGIWIDNDIYVKQLERLDDGSWVARSRNSEKNYQDIPIKTENNGIIGEVQWCGFDIY